MSSETKILIGILIVGLLVGGWWIWNNQRICSADAIKDCNGKKVVIDGIREDNKGCVIDFVEKNGQRNALTVDYELCQEKGIAFGDRIEVVGLLTYKECYNGHDPSKITQCFSSGLNIQQVDSIRVLGK